MAETRAAVSDPIPRRRSLRLVWIGALVVSACIAVTLALLASRAEDRVRASLEARASVERFYHALVSAERAQRAYILTQDEDHLGDYRYSIQKLDGLIEQLREIIDRNGMSATKVDDLHTLARERNRQLEQAITVLLEDGMAAAADQVAHNEVRQTTARIFDLVNAIEEEENRQLAAGERQGTMLRAFLLAMLLATITGALAMSLWAFEAERQLAARLEDMNRHLEDKVGERTRELELERRRVERLLADMSHRLGNNLSMISSYLMLQARTTEDDAARRALEDVHQRIISVATAQRRLHIDSASGSVAIAPYLQALVDDMRATVLHDGIHVELAAEPLSMRGDDAVALGVIANELATNALKHAFPDGTGEISIRLAAKGADGLLEVTDDGIGMGTGLRGGLGSLVVQSMVSGLGGRLVQTTLRDDPERPGSRWRVQFPLRTGEAASEPAAEALRT